MNMHDIQLNEQRIRDMLAQANRQRLARQAQQPEQPMHRRIGRGLIRIGQFIARE